MGEFTEVGLTFRLVVLTNPTIKIVGVADLEAPGGVLKDVYVEHVARLGLKWLVKRTETTNLIEIDRSG